MTLILMRAKTRGWRIDELVEAPDDVAADLVAAGIAELVDDRRTRRRR